MSQHFGVSVLVREGDAAKTVTGNFVATNAVQSVEALAFAVGAKFRTVPSGFFVGADPEKVVLSLPSYGLPQGQLPGGMRDAGSVIGDRIIVETDATRGEQLRTALEPLGQRRSVILELYVLDVASNRVDRVNEWLGALSASAGYAARVAPAVANPAAGAAQMAQQNFSGPTADVQLQALLQLLETERDVRLELRQQVQVMSGSTTRFQSGEVIEQELYTREPMSGQDLVSGIDRRTVGLNLLLSAASYDGRWHLRADFSDSSRSGTGRSARERVTGVTAERVVEGPGLFLLASFTRTSRERVQEAVPLLQRVRWLRKWTRREVITDANRQFMILCRPMF